MLKTTRDLGTWCLLLALSAVAPAAWAVDAVFVAPDGSVGIGTSDPSGLEVQATVSETSADADNMRLGVLAGTPRLVFEDHGFPQWQIDNRKGAFRWYTPGIVRMILETDGDLGIGIASVASGNDIEHANGGALTSGGVWADASSREYKQDVEVLGVAEAMSAFQELVPVTFRYKQTPNERYLGFIAEDVPELVAMEGRKNLAAIEVVALLTTVVQEQQGALREQRDLLRAQQDQIQELAAEVAALRAAPADD